MNEIKLLEIGAEGGGLSFFVKNKGLKEEYFFGSNRDKTFPTVHDILIEYTKNHNPILWYYPVDVHPEIVDELLPILLNELRNNPKDHFMNLEAWEEELGVHFNKMTEDGLQTFKITPVEKTESYNYNHYGEERVLESVTTEYSNKPNLKRVLMGIGKIEGDTFVIRDGDSVICGVFPLNRYEIESL